MDATRKYEVEGRENTKRMSVWLMCIAVAVVTNGCAGCMETIRPNPGQSPRGILPIGCSDTASDCGVATMSLTDQCPTGECPPGGINGKGIYTVVEGNYCFLFGGEPRFCPEAFVKTSDSVMLEVRDLESPREIYKKPVMGKFQGTDVVVSAIQSDKSQLSIKYVLNKKEYTATGVELEKLTLWVGSFRTGNGDASPLANYELKITPIQSEKTQADGVQRYQVRYREAGEQGWLYHCKGKNESPEKPSADAVAAFLGQKRISGLSAFVTSNPNSTTMGCETGAIVTCLSWGYTPWNDKPGTPERSDYAFGSCLQAKRAAYFVGFKDFNTYTVKGTSIFLRDQYGIKDNNIENLEAIWSPAGAVCIDTEKMRRSRFKSTVTNLKNLHKVPSCTPPDWSREGKVATGPEKLQF
ncbi:hypothetical protein F0U61_18735 [Archangium violaceum]|uniref:ADYC domain-containing protein n=1 Tax=Archangium violaceum TaxID=83451 RepID=UPI002B2A8020|nr:hypothetical protein F0U61_18735 [Archangium violaceum]